MRLETVEELLARGGKLDMRIAIERVLDAMKADYKNGQTVLLLLIHTCVHPCTENTAIVSWLKRNADIGKLLVKKGQVYQLKVLS